MSLPSWDQTVSLPSPARTESESLSPDGIAVVDPLTIGVDVELADLVVAGRAVHHAIRGQFDDALDLAELQRVARVEGDRAAFGGRVGDGNRHRET